MINLSELRIGNIVEIMDKKEYVKGIMGNAVYFGEHGFIVNMLDFVEPVLITEKLLLKCGFFKHIKFKNTYCKGSFSIKITDSGVIYFKYNDFVIAELQFIHQLQNLFFSLCGEELVFYSTE